MRSCFSQVFEIHYDIKDQFVVGSVNILFVKEMLQSLVYLYFVLC